MVEAASGQKRRLFPGQLVTGYDLSRDDRVVASVVEPDGKRGLWLATLDGRDPPRRIPHSDGDNPRFGRGGEVLFLGFEGNTRFLSRIRETGENREKVTTASVSVLGTVSPDGEWLSAFSSVTNHATLYSSSGRDPLPLFPVSQPSRLRWSFDGTRAYLAVQHGQLSAFGIGRTYVLPLAKGSVLPPIPAGGFRTEAEIAALPGVEVLPHGDLALGSSPSVYAYSRVTAARNLYRIPLE
jgi:hypothetical protein